MLKIMQKLYRIKWGDWMINLIICDDNKDFLESATLYIEYYLSVLNVDIKVHQFSCSEAFIKVFNEVPYFFDIVILDIDMPGKDGIEVARLIREINQELLIVFLTGITTRVFESFKVGAFRYVRKSHFKEEIEECIQSALKKMRAQTECYIIKTEEGWIKLLVKDIMYFLCVNRHVEVHTIQACYKTTIRRMKDVEEQFENKNFTKIHRGCMVNLGYIKTIEEQKVILDNNELLVMSRYRMQQVFSAYKNHIRQGE